MNYPLTGYHHITACVAGAQEDVDFFTTIVGLRMAKQTVLMDGAIPIYHLYYSNANLEPGSVMTTFPYGAKSGPSRLRSGAVDQLHGFERIAAFLERALQEAQDRPGSDCGALRAVVHSLPASFRDQLRSNRGQRRQARAVAHA